MVYALHYDLKEGSHIFGLQMDTGEERWSFHANAEINASPTLSQDGSTLFVGMKDGEFAAVDTGTGRKKWRFKTTTTASPAISPDGRVIYIGGRDGKLYALAEDALEECLARKKSGGTAGEETVPEVILEDGFLIIDGMKMKVNMG
jgi:outer membrane protein assembly factor BamB